MRPEGWVFLTLSWAGILALCIFCFIRVLSKKK